MDRRILAFAGVSVFVASCTMAPAPTKAAAKSPEPKAEEPSIIKGYRSWHKVNEQPVSIDASVSYLCTDPRSQVRKFADVDPHTRHFITVYVNPVGKQALLKVHDRKQPLPVGTIIVKEKFVGEYKGKPVNGDYRSIRTEQDRLAFERASVPTGAKPELMTVMVKRERGFNPKCFDWEFLTYEPDKHDPLSQGKIASCQSCHTMQPKSDGVFASYVPWPTR